MPRTPDLSHAFRVALRILRGESELMPQREHLQAVNESREAWRREALLMLTELERLRTLADVHMEGDLVESLDVMIAGVKAHDARETEAARC